MPTVFQNPKLYAVHPSPTCFSTLVLYFTVSNSRPFARRSRATTTSIITNVWLKYYRRIATKEQQITSCNFWFCDLVCGGGTTIHNICPTEILYYTLYCSSPCIRLSLAPYYYCLHRKSNLIFKNTLNNVKLELTVYSIVTNIVVTILTYCRDPFATTTITHLTEEWKGSHVRGGGPQF